MRCRIYLVLILFLCAAVPRTHAAETEVAAITFDSHCAQSTNYPSWITTVEQTGGQFSDEPPFWAAGAALPVGQGRVSIVVDRTKLNEDLALQIIYQDDATADMVVQLFDANNQALALDLFANVLAVGREARTDTFIVPLRAYPTATRVTLRRIRGDIKVFGVAMYPVVGVAEVDDETLQALAKLLGDKIGVDSPLGKRLAQLVSEHAGAKYAGPVGQPPKKLESLISAPSSVTPANSGPPTDWVVMPFPSNSDWPGPKGFAAILGNGDFLLRGQPVRTKRSFSVPVRISFDAVLEERLANNGSIWLWLEPADVADDVQAEQNVNVNMSYSGPSAAAGRDSLDVSELLALGEDFHTQSRTLWPKHPFQLNAGETYHVSLLVTAEGMQWTINGETHDLTGVKVPFDKFRVTLFSWQPTNRWHVRNVSIR